MELRKKVCQLRVGPAQVGNHTIIYIFKHLPVVVINMEQKTIKNHRQLYVILCQ